MPEPMPHVDLSFVIPVRNDATGLARCLQSIARASHGIAATEVIVVDNGSEDASGDVARKAGCQVLIVPNDRVGALRNKGAAIAAGALLAFVDADHELGPDWATATLDTMGDPANSAVGAPCDPPAHASWVQLAYDGLRDHRPGRRAVTWLGSGNLVVRREVFQRVGGFDASLEACEDVDLCRRIRASGGVLISDSRLRSIHYGDPVSLQALFRGELWRGRNNLQVSLREPLTLRNLPSVAIPVLDLALIGVFVIAGATGRFGVAAGALALFALPAVARAVQLRRRARVSLLHGGPVALTYDAARALALLMRMQHRRVGLESSVPAR